MFLLIFHVTKLLDLGLGFAHLCHRQLDRLAFSGSRSQISFYVLQPSRSGWQHAFFVAAGFYTSAVVIYVLFGSGEEQEWAKGPRENYVVEQEVIADDPIITDSSAGSSGKGENGSVMTVDQAGKITGPINY